MALLVVLSLVDDDGHSFLYFRSCPFCPRVTHPNLKNHLLTEKIVSNYRTSTWYEYLTVVLYVLFLTGLRCERYELALRGHYCDRQGAFSCQATNNQRMDTVQNLVSYEVGEGVIPGSAASHPLITKMANGRHVNK